MRGAGRMMGPGLIGGGGSSFVRGGDGGLVSASRMQALAAQAARAASRSGNVLTYRSTKVALVALGAPGSRPGMYWQIDGVDNPVVSVPAGSTISVDFANGDPGQAHGFELTSAAPPYPEMAMMAGTVAAPGAFVMPLPAPVGNKWYVANTIFQAPPPGTYYIICPVPGHAQQGMWAKFIVR